MLRRITKIASALAAGNVVYILSQLLLPPAFIAAYGVNGYGEWLALTAGASWTQMLDCGLQTFIINELSLQFHRGNLVRVKQLQSVALRISLAILTIGLLLTACALAAAPLNTLLGLSMTRMAASAIAALLVAEAVLGIIWSQLNGMIRSFGYPHRAEVWAQIYRSLLVAITLGLVLGRAPMWLIPAGRLLTFFGMTLVSLFDLHRLAPQAFPSLAYWDKAAAKEILRPSLWFGSFTLNQFLLFQCPILILNYVAGKPALVAFSICRSFYGVVRQLAQLARSSVAPEITRLAGINDWNRLRRLFNIYEGISFTIGLAGPALAFMAAPKLVPVWARSAQAVSVPLFGAMMVTSIINVGKDTRLALQQATNRHIKAASLCLITYSAFALGCVPCAYLWGPIGIAVLWAVVEVLQLGLVHIENRNVLPSLTCWRLVTLCASGLLLITPAALVGSWLESAGWLTTGLVLAASAVILTVSAATLFGLGDLVFNATLSPLETQPAPVRAGGQQ
jgi:O-antigen/teichoic acid export membrane protein